MPDEKKCHGNCKNCSKKKNENNEVKVSTPLVVIQLEEEISPPSYFDYDEPRSFDADYADQI